MFPDLRTSIWAWSRAPRPALALVAVVALPACGLGWFDESSGGSANLPTLGAGPYGKLPPDFETPADEPIVVGERRASLRDPAVLWREDGGFRLWFGRDPEDGSGDSEIWYAELADLTELPERGPERALAAAEPWTEGRVAAPAVVDLGAGRLVMFYEGGRGPTAATGRADSDDGGQTWRPHPDNPLIGLRAPTAALVEGRWVLLGTLADTPGIVRATSPDGVGWSLEDEPLVVPRPHLPSAFDAVAVGDPYLVVQTTAAGRLHQGLFFTGTGARGDVAIGYAGSFDGRTWHRFAGAGTTLEPVLDPGVPVERGPAVLLTPTRGYMFFHQETQLLQRIGVAVHP